MLMHQGELPTRGAYFRQFDQLSFFFVKKKILKKREKMHINCCLAEKKEQQSLMCQNPEQSLITIINMEKGAKREETRREEKEKTETRNSKATKSN
jgi:hypothetical protein